MKKRNRPKQQKASSFEGRVITNCDLSASDAKADAIDWSQVVDLTSNKSWWRRAADQGNCLQEITSELFDKTNLCKDQG